MPAASPTSLAAVSGPQPVRARSEGREIADQTPRSHARARRSRRQLADPGDEVAGEPSDGPGSCQALFELGQDVGSTGSAAWLIARHEMPGAGDLVLGPGRDEILGDRRAGAPRARVPRGWRPAGRFTEGGPGDRQDRIALAWFPGGAAGPGHQLGRHPDDALAGAHEVTLERPRQVAAVLERDRPLRPSAEPAAELEMAGRWHPPSSRRACVPVPSTATRVWLRLCRSAPMTTISRVSSQPGVTAEDRSTDTPEWGRCHAPMKSRRPVRRVRRPAQRMQATPTRRAPMLRAKPSDTGESDTHADASAGGAAVHRVDSPGRDARDRS